MRDPETALLPERSAMLHISKCMQQRAVFCIGGIHALRDICDVSTHHQERDWYMRTQYTKFPWSRALGPMNPKAASPATNSESAFEFWEFPVETPWKFQGGNRDLGKPFGPWGNFARHLEHIGNRIVCANARVPSLFTSRVTRRREGRGKPRKERDTTRKGAS